MLLGKLKKSEIQFLAQVHAAIQQLTWKALTPASDNGRGWEDLPKPRMTPSFVRLRESLNLESHLITCLKAEGTDGDGAGSSSPQLLLYLSIWSQL